MRQPAAVEVPPAHVKTESGKAWVLAPGRSAGDWPRRQGPRSDHHPDLALFPLISFRWHSHSLCTHFDPRFPASHFKHTTAAAYSASSPLSFVSILFCSLPSSAKTLRLPSQRERALPSLRRRSLIRCDSIAYLSRRNRLQSGLCILFDLSP